MRRTIGVDLTPKQAYVVHSEAKLVAARGGIGSGKTYAAIWKMWRFMRKHPKAAPYVCGADFEQLRGGYFLSFRNILEEQLKWKEGIDFTYRDSPRPTIIFKDTGVRVRALSAEIAERIRSTEIQFLHCEEPQTWHNGEQVYRTLIGRMRQSVRSAKHYPDLKPQGILTFNPPLVGTWLYNLVEEKWKEFGYPCVRFSLRENYLLQGLDEYIKLQETNLPPSLWPVEIEGHYGTTGGEVYRMFEAERNTTPLAGMPPLALDPTKPIQWGLDFNVGLMCSVIAQTHWQQPLLDHRFGEGLPTNKERLPWPLFQKRILYVLDEIKLADAGAEDMVSDFIKRFGDHARRQGVYLYGDASGGARSQVMSSMSANRTPWEAIINGLRAARIPIVLRIQRANPPVWDRVTYHNQQLWSADGTGMLVHPQCTRLIGDYREVRRAPGKNEIDKSDDSPEGLLRTHMSDAAGYLAWVERKLAQKPNSVEWTMVR